MSDTLHFAFEYLERGWPVIPVNGKIPSVSWKAYQERRPKPDQVKQWFDSDSKNVAIITGSASGLVVVDCDTAEDATWWQENYPTTPLVVVTGRGGKHFYYRYPDTTIGNRAGILGRKIDVRGEGGLVVAPPSVHPETKREYIFEPWGYYCLEEIPFFDPAWLGEEEKERGKPANLNGDIRSGVRYIQKIRAISGEGGHNATFRAACKLRDSGLTEEEALDVLLSWNETNCEPRWTQRELLHKVQSSFRRAAP